MADTLDAILEGAILFSAATRDTCEEKRMLFSYTEKQAPFGPLIYLPLPLYPTTGKEGPPPCCC